MIKEELALFYTFASKNEWLDRAYFRKQRAYIREQAYQSWEYYKKHIWQQLLVSHLLLL